MRSGISQTISFGGSCSNTLLWKNACAAPSNAPPSLAVGGPVLAGPVFMPVPSHPAIRALGTVYGLKIESSTFELQGAAAWDDAIEILDPGSLGTLIRVGNDYLLSGDWWISIFPGIVLALLILSVNLLGDWLREALNPRLR